MKKTLMLLFLFFLFLLSLNTLAASNPYTGQRLSYLVSPPHNPKKSHYRQKGQLIDIFFKQPLIKVNFNHYSHMIYDERTQLFTFIHINKKKYWQINAGKMRKMAVRVNSLTNSVTTQIAKMSKKYQKMMQGFLEDNLPGLKNDKNQNFFFKKSATIASFKGRKATKYILTQNKKKKLEVLLVDWNSLGLKKPPKQFVLKLEKIITPLLDLLKKAMKKNHIQTLLPLKKLIKEGLPVHITVFNKGKKMKTISLTKVKDQVFKKSFFKLPTGFVKKSPPLKGFEKFL